MDALQGCVRVCVCSTRRPRTRSHIPPAILRGGHSILPGGAEAVHDRPLCRPSILHSHIPPAILFCSLTFRRPFCGAAILLGRGGRPWQAILPAILAILPAILAILPAILLAILDNHSAGHSARPWPAILPATEPAALLLRAWGFRV